jgi:hypothetical protein
MIDSRSVGVPPPTAKSSIWGVTKTNQAWNSFLFIPLRRGAPSKIGRVTGIDFCFFCCIFYEMQGLDFKKLCIRK